MTLGWIVVVAFMLAFLLWAARTITHGQAQAHLEEARQESEEDHHQRAEQYHWRAQVAAKRAQRKG